MEATSFKLCICNRLLIQNPHLYRNSSRASATSAHRQRSTFALKLIVTVTVGFMFAPLQEIVPPLD